MSALGKARKERPQAEYEAQAKELRSQFGEQLRGLEAQTEARQQLLQELGEFLRRKAELELEYSRGLEKLAERFSARLRGAKEQPRKDPDLPSPLRCWQLLLKQTRQAGRDHGALSDIYAGPLTLRLAQLSEDVGRLAKKSKELEQQLQDELLAMVSELQTAMKTYQMYHVQCQSAENKLRDAERQEEKRGARQPPEPGGGAGGPGPDKTPRRTSLRKGERLLEKRQVRAVAARRKRTMARNEYLLHLGATNAALRGYYLHDVADLLDCSDLGFHLSLGRLLQNYLAAEGRAQRSWQEGLGALEGAVLVLDPPGDKALLMEAAPAAYCPPSRFEYHPQEGDEVSEVRAPGSLRQELLLRCEGLDARLEGLSLETDEVKKTLAATLRSLQALLGAEEPEVLEAFGGPESPRGSGSGSGSDGRGWAKRRAQQQETETFYLSKLEQFLGARSVGAKLRSKLEALRAATAEGAAEDGGDFRAPPLVYAPRVQPVLAAFPTDLEAFVQESGQPIPLVVQSCVRYINLHGLQHEGIFRVPGPQARVSEIREAFERGEDPLAGSSCPRDVDSVAGVLKFFFRSLRSPPVPPAAVPELLAAAQLEAPAERVSHLRGLLLQLPPPVLVVLRYLFAFLNHVSQFSDENMMGPHNLAVCFGPTLVAPPPGLDPVSAQPQANEAVKWLIQQPEALFPDAAQLPGPLYEKCMALHAPDDDCEVLSLDPAVEESEGDGPAEPPATPSEDGPAAGAVAVARFPYAGRSAQELSFQRGDRIRLLAEASADWWRGELGGALGLVPHKYLSLSASSEQGPSPRNSSSDGDSGSPPAEPASRLRVNSDGGRQGRPRAGASPIRKLAPSLVDLVRAPLPPQPPGAPRAAHRAGRGAAGEGPPAGGRPTRGDKQGPPEKHMEMDKARNMEPLFRELLGRTRRKQEGGDDAPEPPRSPPAGKKGPAPPKCAAAPRSKGLCKAAGDGD